MRGVGLTYRGQPVKTDPDFAVDWEWTDDPLDFFSISQGSSYPINIPVAGNDHIFFDISHPDSTQEIKDIEDFAITQDGNLMFQCVFNIEDISDDGHYYEGTLTTIETKFFENKDRSIREILADTTWTYPAGGYATVYAYFNGTTNRGIRFPWMHFYNERNFVYPTASIVHVINSDNFALPCFHMEHIFRLLMLEMGYEVNINLTQPYLENLLLYTQKVLKLTSLETDVSYGEFLPDLSLTDFIREVEFYTGATVTKDIFDKTIRLESHQYTINREPVDCDGKTSEAKPGRFPFKNIVARMNYESDYLLAENPTELSGNYLGEFVNADDISLTSGGVEGDYAFAKGENAYFKFATINDNLELEYFSHPFLERKTGTDDPYIMESLLSPCIKDRYYFGEFDVDADLLEDNSYVAGRCLLQGFEDQTIVTEYDFIGILEFKERDKQAPRLINYQEKTPIKNFVLKTTLFLRYGVKKKRASPVVTTGKKIPPDYYIGYRKPKLYSSYGNSTGAAPDDNKIHFSLEYIEDSGVSKIVMAKQLDYYLPIIGKKLSRGSDVYLQKESNEDDLSGGILTWHGLVDRFGKTSTYPYASCDNFYFNSIDLDSELPEQNLNFQTGTNNLWANIFNPLHILYRTLKLITFTAYLGAEDLTALIRNRIGKVYTRRFLIKSAKMSFDKDGQGPQRIEGYRL